MKTTLQTKRFALALLSLGTCCAMGLSTGAWANETGMATGAKATPSAQASTATATSAATPVKTGNAKKVHEPTAAGQGAAAHPNQAIAHKPIAAQ